ncbi:MAG: hypothetical protein ABIR26_11350, partial [Ramlibacter sp.]
MTELGRTYCDLVMKGGITSGVVFPKAIATLAKHYRFCNIGGTSAGAIAAAGAAAAEYRRAKSLGRNDMAGFQQLEDLPAFLGKKTTDNRSQLFHLFRPEAGTRRQFEIAAGALNRSGVASIVVHCLLASVSRFWLPAIVGAVPAVLLYLGLGEGAFRIIDSF